MIEHALKYHKLGFRVIPTGENKIPLCKWATYRESQTEEQVRELFSRKGILGIAIITGVDGLECVDIDCKYDDEGGLFTRYVKYIEKFEKVNVYELLVQATPSGGFHFFYRCEKNEGNLKLAMRPATFAEVCKHNADPSNEKKVEDPNKLPKVLIETRGVGGYVLVYPSPGYELQNGKGFENLPTVSIEQRSVIINSARALNRIETDENISLLDRKVNREKERVKAKYDNPDMRTCWDAYNESDEVLDCLQAHGWKEISGMESKDRVYLRRPGKSVGLSADYHKDKKRFTCWSTSTIFEDAHAYTPFSVFAILEHNGDSSAAAKELYKLGYGDRFVKDGKEIVDVAKPEAPKKLLWFDPFKPPENIKAVLSVEVDGRRYPVAGAGMLGAFVGKEKSRKTTALTSLVASDLAGGESKLNFRLNLDGKDILFVDTEQPEQFFFDMQKRILQMAGVYEKPERYRALSLRQYDYKERIKIISDVLDENRKYGLIIIDGVNDICKDFNDVIASKEAVQQLMTWGTETGALIITVLHLTKAMGYMNGHLGSELGRKCDFTAMTIKDDDTDLTTVKSHLSRFAPFPSYEFGQVPDGIPILAGSMFDITGRHKDSVPHPGEQRSISINSTARQESFDAADDLMRRIADANKNDDTDIPF